MAVSGHPKLQLLLLPPFASHPRSPPRPAALHLPSSCSKVSSSADLSSFLLYLAPVMGGIFSRQRIDAIPFSPASVSLYAEGLRLAALLRCLKIFSVDPLARSQMVRFLRWEAIDCALCDVLLQIFGAFFNSITKIAISGRSKVDWIGFIPKWVK